MTCDAHLRTWPSYSSQKSYAKILFDWLSLSRVVSTNKQTYKHSPPPPKKKKITDATENNILRKNSFPGGKISDAAQNNILRKKKEEEGVGGIGRGREGGRERDVCHDSPYASEILYTKRRIRAVCDTLVIPP